MASRPKKNAPENGATKLYMWTGWRRSLRDDLRRETADLEIERKWLTWTRYEPDCFDFFVKKYLDRIYGYLVRDLGDPEVARELTHETFCRAYEKLGQFRLRDVTIGAWLYRIATNLRNQHWQQRKRRLERQVPANEDLLRDERTAEETLQRKQTETQLRGALLELREEYQNVLLLHYWEGLSTSQIAVVLDRKHNTIKGWLQRARHDLEKLLKRRGIRLQGSADTVAAETDGPARSAARAARNRKARA